MGRVTQSPTPTPDSSRPSSSTSASVTFATGHADTLAEPKTFTTAPIPTASIVAAPVSRTASSPRSSSKESPPPPYPTRSPRSSSNRSLTSSPSTPVRALQPSPDNSISASKLAFDCVEPVHDEPSSSPLRMMLRRSNSTKSSGSNQGQQMQDPTSASGLDPQGKDDVGPSSSSVGLDGSSLAPPTESRTRSTSLLSSLVRRLPGLSDDSHGSGRKRATTSAFQPNVDAKAHEKEKKMLEDALAELKSKPEQSKRDRILAVTIESQLDALQEFTKSPSEFLFEPPDHYLTQHLIDLSRTSDSNYVHPSEDVIPRKGSVADGHTDMSPTRSNASSLASPLSQNADAQEFKLPPRQRSRSNSAASGPPQAPTQAFGAPSIGSDGEGGSSSRRRRCSFIANNDLYIDHAPPLSPPLASATEDLS